MMDLRRKVSIITGSARGIGLGITEKFAEAGSDIVVLDRRAEFGVKIAKDIADKYSVRTMYAEVDVSSEEDVNECVANVVKTLGKVDVLVNNAGIQIINKINEFKLDDWHKLMDVHLTGSFLMTKACMNNMIKNGNGGKVLIIGSVHSVTASPNKPAYIAAKHAQMGLNRAIAREGFENNISSNLIGPGWVMTDLVKEQLAERAKINNCSIEEVAKQNAAQHLDGKYTTLEEVANTALFFASFPGCAVSGQSMLVTHGWMME